MKFNSRGFTVLEVLVVIMVLGVIGYVLADLLSRSFQGSNKTTVIGNVKQSGQVVMDTMVAAIRSADSIPCVSNDKSTVAIKKKDGTYTRFIFRPANPNQDIAQDFPVVNNDNTDSDDVICTTVTGSQTKLTDKNQILLNAGSFTKETILGKTSAIKIQFNLKPATTATSFDYLLGGSDNTMQFDTTVEVR